MTILTDWQIDDLVALVRERYPDWDGFDHPPFVADEIAYKQRSVARAAELLGEDEVERLLAGGEYDTFIERLERLGQDNNLLWRAVPRQGDLAILYDPRLNRAEFCYVMRQLLYGQRPSPERLQAFSDYATRSGLPNKWPFPTYFLFLLHPETELFVKPTAAQWFLKFVGLSSAYTRQPGAETYRCLCRQAQQLAAGLARYGPRDQVDIQSFIWVCMRESEKRTGRLDSKGQVELDVPPRLPEETAERYEIERPTAVLHEGADTDDPAYSTATPSYSLAQFAAETGYPEEELGRWARVALRKKQAIFYGPPGTGKTFLAQKLARHLVGGTDGRIELVQFHPAYSYEEFIQGIRPQTLPDGRLSYEWVDGRFLTFCRQARHRSGPSVLIIDEINRANLARVFGELMYLLEYRDQEIPLAGGRPFHIPENVILLGTMNTADRSIALVDHALRRRFAFIQLAPNYEVLRRYHAGTGFPIDSLISTLQALNQHIGDPHYQVGISFFLRPQLAAELPDIWQMEIEPYLEEYFFDQPDRLREFRWRKIQPRIVPGGT